MALLNFNVDPFGQRKKREARETKLALERNRLSREAIAQADAKADRAQTRQQKKSLIPGARMALDQAGVTDPAARFGAGYHLGSAKTSTELAGATGLLSSITGSTLFSPHAKTAADQAKALADANLAKAEDAARLEGIQADLAQGTYADDLAAAGDAAEVARLERLEKVRLQKRDADLRATPAGILNAAYEVETGQRVPSGFRGMQNPSGRWEAVPLEGTDLYDERRNKVRATETLLQTIQDFIDFFDKKGPQLFDTPTAMAMSEKRQAIINQIRGLENLGTPQAAEMEALADRLPDPTAFWTANAWSNRIWQGRISAPYTELQKRSTTLLKQQKSDYWYIDARPDITP